MLVAKNTSSLHATVYGEKNEIKTEGVKQRFLRQAFVTLYCEDIKN